MDLATVLSFLQAGAAIAEQLPAIWTKVEEIIAEVKATLATDDQTTLEAQLVIYRARMPQIQADTDAALTAAGKKS